MKLNLLLAGLIALQFYSVEARPKIPGQSKKKKTSRTLFELKPKKGNEKAEDEFLDQFEQENQKKFPGFFKRLKSQMQEKREERKRQRLERKRQGESDSEIVDFQEVEDCQRINCRLWIHISKASQKATVFFDGEFQSRLDIDVSTGKPESETPNFDKHPNGRIYEKYSSSKYPGGDYLGLGNMPYAVFISGGYAFHGTPSGNFQYLGRKASHGCIRMHPDYAKVLNHKVQEVGIDQSWITVSDNDLPYFEMERQEKKRPFGFKLFKK